MQPAQIMAQSGRLPRRGAGAGPGPPRVGVEGAARPDRGGAQGRPAAGGGRDLQPRARHRHGRGRPGHPGRVAAVGRERPAAGRPGRPPGRCRLARRHLPEVPRRPRADRGGRRADARRRRSRRCATRATRSTCSPSRSWRWWRWTSGTSRRCTTWCAAPRTTPSLPRSAFEAVLDMLVRALPVRRVRRAAAAAGVGPGRRHADRPARRAAAGRDQRRHHPRPRAVRRLPGRREEVPGRRAGRGDGLRVAGRRRVHPRLDRPGGSRTSPTTGCSSRPAPGQPGPAAVLEGRHARPAGRARAGRSARSSASSAAWHRRRPGPG